MGQPKFVLSWLVTAVVLPRPVQSLAQKSEALLTYQDIGAGLSDRYDLFDNVVEVIPPGLG